MSHLFATHDWRWAIRHSRLLCMAWSADPQDATTQREKLAYAQSLGRPIRLLCLDDTRLPEDLCVGYEDLQAARVASQEEGGRQIKAWLAELDAREGV